MKKGTLMVLASYVLWGLLTIFWKLLADIDSFYVLCCRIVFSLAVSAAARKKRIPQCSHCPERSRAAVRAP